MTLWFLQQGVDHLLEPGAWPYPGVSPAAPSLTCHPWLSLHIRTEPQQWPTERETKRLSLCLAPAVQLRPPSFSFSPLLPLHSAGPSERPGGSAPAPGAVPEESRAAAAKGRARSCGIGHRPAWLTPPSSRGQDVWFQPLRSMDKASTLDLCPLLWTWASLGLLMPARVDVYPKDKRGGPAFQGFGTLLKSHPGKLAPLQAQNGLNPGTRRSQRHCSRQGGIWGHAGRGGRDPPFTWPPKLLSPKGLQGTRAEAPR